MLSVLGRRWPTEILIYPVPVQGDGAAEKIAQAISAFNAELPQTDVLLLGRGGGSLEDLWAFNEEIVARAIAASNIPVVSCVGHETDFTIADFVADRRAPTPSAAAELATPDRWAVLSEIASLSGSLESAVKALIRELERRLIQAASHPFLKSPRRLYEERARRIDETGQRLAEAMHQTLLHAEKDLRLQVEKLEAISPLKVLSRGYCIAEKMPAREILRSASEVSPGDRLSLRLFDGQIRCEVRNEQDH
jgi:exodeoxyribonuclease VII large subunit